MKSIRLIALLGVALVVMGFTAAADYTFPVANKLKLAIQQFYGSTGANFLRVPDNLASALIVEDTENGGDLLLLSTTNSSEKFTVASRYLGLTSLAAGVTAATGSAQLDGPMTTTAVQVSTAASAGDAVTLPTAVAGLVAIVCNRAAANAIDVFPFTSDAINKETANTAISLAAGECMWCLAFDAVQWGCTIGSAT